MNINQNHLFYAFIATLVGVILLALVGNQQLGGTLGLIDALTGLLLIEGGAIAGANVPKK